MFSTIELFLHVFALSVVSLRAPFLVFIIFNLHFLFNDVCGASKVLVFILFTDDTNFFFHKKMSK